MGADLLEEARCERDQHQLWIYSGCSEIVENSIQVLIVELSHYLQGRNIKDHFDDCERTLSVCIHSNSVRL